MEDAAVLIHDGIDHGMGRASVLRLDVEDTIADANVCVEAGAHERVKAQRARAPQNRGAEYEWEFI